MFIALVGEILGDDWHEKWVLSLVNGTIGCVHGEELGAKVIGANLALEKNF